MNDERDVAEYNKIAIKLRLKGLAFASKQLRKQEFLRKDLGNRFYAERKRIAIEARKASIAYAVIRHVPWSKIEPYRNTQNAPYVYNVVGGGFEVVYTKRLFVNFYEDVERMVQDYGGEEFKDFSYYDLLKHPTESLPLNFKIGY